MIFNVYFPPLFPEEYNPLKKLEAESINSAVAFGGCAIFERPATAPMKPFFEEDE